MRFAFLLLAVATVAGCAGPAPKAPIVVAPPVSPLKELETYQVEMRDELRLIAKHQEAKNSDSLSPEQHDQRYFNATYIPAGFEQRVQLRITDKSSKVAEAVASIANWKIKFYGRAPAHEPYVNIEVDNLPLKEALNELNLQTGSTARIELYEPARLIRYVYLNQ